MKARKKSGASAPKDKNMELKHALAKKYAGEEATRFALYESQNDFISGKKALPKSGVGTYAAHAQNMRKYERKKVMQEKHALAKMNRKERKDYKATKAQKFETQSVSAEKTVYVVFPYDQFQVPFCRTLDGANHRLEKNYDAWIMSQLQCDYEEIRIEVMPESQALALI